ncbi:MULTISPECIES: hypothetical protein [Vibrio]|uniref:Uncharacterized protein n=1 Tax=Vibrio ordalii FS-238 TaxID=617133 RepID=A0A853R8M6_9VIBR|nr:MULTISPECIES: hypothetical protein [Vibrio]AQM20519.1 hypothetical protein PN51_12310 [Vibrio anguillarum]AQP37116.1 hypothetical protein AA909_12465 [Vibrio anguillarum]AUB88965.1 hypothetical protein CKY00_17215 [Vibrio anguillarum]AUB92405.1 hypothetical protein CKX99_17230 [Vibrio anguillarum]AUB95840.1 hypothetical protein CK210_17215 [Vibrio anguillarum]
MSWLDSLSEAGGELLDAASSAGGSWINGTVQNDLAKKQASDPDEARKSQVQGQTADGQPIHTQAQGLNTNYLIVGVGVLVLLLLVFMLAKGGK